MRLVCFFVMYLLAHVGWCQPESRLLAAAEGYLGLGDTTHAVEAFELVLTKYPQSFAAALRLTETHLAQAQYYQGILYANLAIDIGENYLQEAVTYQYSADKQAQMQRNIAAAHHLKGTLRRKQKRPAESMDELSRSYALNPNSFPLLLDLGIAYFEVGAMSETLRYLNEALAIKPDHPAALLNLAHAYKGQLNYDSAMIYYQKAVGGFS